MLTDWTPPESFEEALERRRALRAEIEEINAQLGDKLKRTKSEMTWDEYQRWRTAAIWASTNRLQELRLINDWIRQASVSSPLQVTADVAL